MMRGHGNLELGQGFRKRHTWHVQHFCDVLLGWNLRCAWMLMLAGMLASVLSKVHHTKMKCQENVNHSDTLCSCTQNYRTSLTAIWLILIQERISCELETFLLCCHVHLNYLPLRDEVRATVHLIYSCHILTMQNIRLQLRMIISILGAEHMQIA
jgi:hypothetical protein